jgi:acyl-CoA synthetase (AMP-forming)/AMP-acid ligase II
MGDIGHVDKDGFLFLTDRKNFMIISGGVNIYPQEIENVLITHSSVCDVAVIGVPDEELGETVLAVVQPAAGVKGDDRLAETLRLYARNGLGGVKTPKHFEFRDDPLREPTGKLLKAKLIAEFKARGVAAGG